MMPLSIGRQSLGGRPPLGRLPIGLEDGLDPGPEFVGEFPNRIQRPRWRLLARYGKFLESRGIPYYKQIHPRPPRSVLR